jgi:hypothetical protein
MTWLAATPRSAGLQRDGSGILPSICLASPANCGGSFLVSGRMGVPPAGWRILRQLLHERSNGFDGTKDCSGKMPEPAGGTPTLPERRWLAANASRILSTIL